MRRDPWALRSGCGSPASGGAACGAAGEPVPARPGEPEPSAVLPGWSEGPAAPALGGGGVGRRGGRTRSPRLRRGGCPRELGAAFRSLSPRGKLDGPPASGPVPAQGRVLGAMEFTASPKPQLSSRANAFSIAALMSSGGSKEKGPAENTIKPLGKSAASPSPGGRGGGCASGCRVPRLREAPGGGRPPRLARGSFCLSLGPRSQSRGSEIISPLRPTFPWGASEPGIQAL